MNNKKVTILFILIASLILLGIGVTFAYYTSSADFENEFNTALYQTQATETFESPDNWMPGDTTPKTLTIKNTGNVNVKARVCLTEEWTSHNGDTLPLEQNGNKAAIINLANTSDWTYRLGCYEYNDVLEPNDTTSSFMESVTFNSLIEADLTCTTNTVGNSTTRSCTSSGNGYDNATYTLTLRAETVQANKVEEVWPNPITYVNRQNEGQITTGDEIAIDTEHFYVVSSDENETVLLSKYNLLVGDVFDVDTTNWTYTLNKTLSSSDTGYGLQNENAKGWIPSETGETTARYVGTVGFSGTNYWDNSVCQYTGSSWGCTGTRGLKSEYTNASNAAGTASYTSPYPYVYRSNIGNTTAPNINYDSGSGKVQNNGYTISYYVENYVNTLKTLGAPDTITGRLMSQEEAVSLGCSKSSYTCKYSPATAPSWVYSTSYWLGSAGNNGSSWGVNSDGGFDSDYFYNDNSYGCRPVIEIPTDLLNNL